MQSLDMVLQWFKSNSEMGNHLTQFAMVEPIINKDLENPHQNLPSVKHFHRLLFDDEIYLYQAFQIKQFCIAFVAAVSQLFRKIIFFRLPNKA